MSNSELATNRPRGQFRLWGRQLWWQLAVPGLYFVGMFLYYPFRNAFWMDHDEGINLVKAQLVLRGYSLYTDIWNDQPPLLTYLLAGVFRVFGLRINVGRGLVLLFACALFFLYLNYLYNVWGTWAALAGIILLFLLPRFTDLSVSVMIGLPSIALAMLSMGSLVYWHRQRRYLWLILSALGLGASVLTKLFTGFLAPIFLAGIVIGEYAKYRNFKDWRRVLLPGFVWGAVFTLVVILPVWMFVGSGNLNQLLEDHLSGVQVPLYRDDPTISLSYQLIEARITLVLAALGLLDALIFRRWLAFYPMAWMLAAYALLSRHAPVWSHQQLLVTVPAVILAAGVTGVALERIRDLFSKRFRLRWVDLVHLASLGVFAWIVIARVPITLSAFNKTPALRSPPFREASTEVTILNKIREYAPQTDWFVTDLPIYAFYTGLRIPPNLAVFSSKRVETGNLTEAEVLATIKTLQPEQILFGRNQFPAVQQYLDEHYQVVHAREPLYLYLIDELAPPDENKSN